MIIKNNINVKGGNMKTTLEAQKALDSIAEKKGFKIFGSPLNISRVNHIQKIITIQAFITDKRNITMSHELGHIYLFKVWKWMIVINELMAWIVGYLVCKKNRIDTKDFWKIARKCLKTYING